MKKNVLTIAMLVFAMLCQAQDMIVTKNGDVIKAKVFKVGVSEVEYKKWSNQDGPSYAMLRSEILAITYQSGEKEMFDTPTLKQETTKNNQTTSTSNSEFAPAINLTPTEIESQINKINPYTLYKRGAIAEYKFQQDGEDFAFMGGPTYIQQIVADVKVENGFLVPYIQQRYFNKKHNPSKGIPDKALQYLFPTEIDINGNYHLTHDVSKDYFFVKARKGYALLMPSEFEVGQSIQSSTLIDEVSGGIMAKMTMRKTYSNFKVEKMEQAVTPAGTFDCVKITGDLYNDNSTLGGNEHYDMWIARGIGVVRLDITPITKKGNGKMYTMYLNHIDMK